MDSLDKEILNEIQWTFPLTPKPFDDIAKKFDTTPEIIKERLINLKKIGVLRQLSAIFDTRRLGYKSSLIAMEIESDKLEHVANQINRHPGVSHNYQRDHQFNLWFTLAVPPGSDLKTEVDKFSILKGIKKVRMLPTIKLFKIGVKLDMVDEKKHDVIPSEEKKEINNIKFVPTETDKEFIRELQKDMDIIDRPFLDASKKLGLTEHELFEKLKYYENIGVMRRFAAILRHREVGFTANGMIVWNVPDEKIEEVGLKLGAFPQVSHCYQRPTYPDWPYSVFSMIHCKSEEEAGEMTKTIQSQINIPDYKILFSTREFKKTRVEYFVESNFSLEDLISTS
ncbi:MAG: Lrp/AsnC family transcriptional regulator [Nitrosarchaeum sp.]|nr:Lrp/AsnC family transcriptional regulator [Nitrosarchaeum sp.]MBP0119330.1 Lrp/AsnC family transcriptional regulator [Nitrosarchaeum sp.]MBP0133725.1 Lrp/AsnC family transcriptional regulator [Nitrosarchaeum sp.]MSV26709.1 Lrp/AsnC family transcriptional regulator [Nitrosarchaeum sp.]PHY09385.1 MAG: transcriptional regulator [Nitrosarchaeum sp.]